MADRETLECGILIDGEPLAQTEWCLREPAAWWAHDSDHRQAGWPGAMARDRYQMTPRNGVVVDQLWGHWTAGEAGAKSIYDDGPRVVAVMKRRKGRVHPDRRLRVSVQFVIGACAPGDEWAPVWQTMDLGRGFGAIHVGRGTINAKSIGVEVVSAGIDGQTNIRDRPEVEVEMFGGRRDVLAFYRGQLRSWVRLANALTEKCLPGGIEIPRLVPAELRELVDVAPFSRRMTYRQLRKWAGAAEHYLMDNTRKVDAGTLLLRALLDDGWKPSTTF